ncbi:hypothetical protein CDAR_281161 [Caerostris darwini]|uniref:Uncharacterized protein n=1 Tax=Caerostris darwini TaxID=1538125 RepID=A0AAV4WXZ1_9ARAC|nr:hypothetical protein CDAR_281161 [Caerostris darwini]
MYHIKNTGNRFACKAVSRVNIYPQSQKCKEILGETSSFFSRHENANENRQPKSATKDEKLFSAIIQSAAKARGGEEIQLPCRNYSNEAAELQDNCQGWKSPPSFLDISSVQ